MAATPQPPTADPVQAEAEAAGEPLAAEVRGIVVHLPSSADDWPVEASLALERGKAMLWLQMLIDEADWSKLMKLRPRLTNGELGEALRPVMERYGFGESGN